MALIAMSGAARSKAMEAIMLSKQKDFKGAAELLETASKELKDAHKVQTRLIQEEAGGTKQEITLLMIHAQDHLMNAMTVKDMAREFVELYEHTQKN
ncbi:Lichenan-specific phosphotransferase enzyme IIA component [compost metagenome]